MPEASSTPTQMGGNISAVGVQVLPGLGTYHQIQTGTQREMQFMPAGQTQRRAGCKSSVDVPLSKKPVGSNPSNTAARSPGDVQRFCKELFMTVINLFHV